MTTHHFAYFIGGPWHDTGKCLDGPVTAQFTVPTYDVSRSRRWPEGVPIKHHLYVHVGDGEKQSYYEYRGII